MPTTRHTPTAALLAVIALGVLFRFLGLETHVFWHDEVYTRFFAAGYQAHDWKPVLFTGEVLSVEDVLRFQRSDPDKGILDTVLGLANDEPQHPPLYYVLVRGWVGVFGDSVGALRALSAALSVLALPAMAWLCREVAGTWRAGLLGAALLAVSPFFVLYAQEAREYALWSVFILATNASLLAAIRVTRGGRSALGLWGVFSVLTTTSLYVAFSSYAVILAQIAYVLFACRGRPNRVSLSAAGAMAVSALLFAPWAWMLWGNLEAFQAAMAWTRTIIVPRTEILTTLALNLARPTIDLWDGLDGALPAAGVAAAIAVLAAGWVAVLRRRLEAVALLVLLVVVPVSLLVVPDLLWGGIRSLSTRYLTASLAAGLVVLATWLSHPGSGSQGLHHPVARSLVTVALILAGVSSCLWNGRHPAPWTKGVSVSLPEVAARINRSERPLLVTNMERHHPGNVLALCHLLRPEARLQFIPFGVGYERPWSVEGDFTDIFLFSPVPPFVDEPYPVPSDKLYEDIFLELWRVRP